MKNNKTNIFIAYNDYNRTWLTYDTILNCYTINVVLFVNTFRLTCTAGNIDIYIANLFILLSITHADMI